MRAATYAFLCVSALAIDRRGVLGRLRVPCRPGSGDRDPERQRFSEVALSDGDVRSSRPRAPQHRGRDTCSAAGAVVAEAGFNAPHQTGVSIAPRAPRTRPRRRSTPPASRLRQDGCRGRDSERSPPPLRLRQQNIAAARGPRPLISAQATTTTAASSRPPASPSGAQRSGQHSDELDYPYGTARRGNGQASVEQRSGRAGCRCGGEVSEIMARRKLVFHWLGVAGRETRSAELERETKAKREDAR